MPASSSAVIGPDPDPHSCDLSALPVPHFSPIFHPRYIEAVSALFLPPPIFITLSCWQDRVHRILYIPFIHSPVIHFYT